MFKVLRYYFLFKSIRGNGFKTDEKNPESFPWVFMSKEITSRFDGHHRASIARHLGYNELPVLLITPKDILGINDLPLTFQKYMIELEEPDIDELKTFN